MVPFGKEQVKDELSRADHAGGLGLHVHPFGNGESTCRLQHALAFDFHDADAASADRTQRGMIAERRDVDARLLRRLEDGASNRRGDCLAIDG
jgi:hypothetical protein